ncbi:tRNA (guanosine(46)-N7)-methyltransferase TrmB [Lamprobacter modestohalophilus]|uniref:tRNA (guanine-N(7)-)-methyltransferase n=1 Tax=Lamprobacter modestohalophilus TaxID=1064514 RepID=A0A9X1B6C3_9GAMM|nr:tRNA (guanosine(46)-N7)-methyltransferase TrmB [Lamprobacter modestohalophilus]MBK1621029.1 tRNA (guanosine(46)-N7)-methyltransferase TrmB [Lamprobacter modestohalophilus]
MDKTNRNAIQNTTKVLKLSNRDAGNAAEPAPAEARERIPRPIRSFVLREGRLTAGQERAFRELWPRFGVDWQPGETLDPQALFAAAQPDLTKPRPITLEIGFGNGESLATMAAAAPERDFIGLEVHRPGVGHLLLLLEQQGLTNVRVLRADATALLETGLPAASLDRVQLFFPDPWPKKRHHKRRIVQPSFVAAVARTLQSAGIFHLATDWTPYAEWMLTMLDDANTLFENCAGPGQFSPRPAQRPLTKFERRGQRLGHQVHDLIYRRR